MRGDTMSGDTAGTGTGGAGVTPCDLSNDGEEDVRVVKVSKSPTKGGARGAVFTMSRLQNPAGPAPVMPG